ncbi:MAG: hypothetical protein ABI743_00870 [bacterium]
MRRAIRLPLLVLLTLGVIGPSMGLAQPGTTDWAAPAPYQVEQFLAAFAPSMEAAGGPADYVLPVSRLNAIASAWGTGDRLMAADLILQNPDGALFVPVGEAQRGLAAARSLALWWPDREARQMFLGYYTAVYLKDPALSRDPQAFATRYLQGASIPDASEPARFLYDHLDRYGYAASEGVTPAGFLYDLYNTFDQTLVDAAKLGLPLDQMALDLSAYRNGVMSRLVNSIRGAEAYADARAQSFESWGELVTPAQPEPMDSTTPPADAMDTAPAVAVPVAPPATNWAEIDIFAVPNGMSAPTASYTPPASPIETSIPSPSGDPVIFEELPPVGGEPATPDEPIEDAAPSTAPANTADALGATLIEDAGPAAAIPAPDVFAEPAPEAPAEPVVAGPSADQLAANHAAGQKAWDGTVKVARQLGQQATELVQLWAEGGDGESHKATVDAAEKAFSAQKQLFLADLYLIDIYGVGARLQMASDEVDEAILAALFEFFNTQKDLGNEAVLAVMGDVEKALNQIGQGVTQRASTLEIAHAQQTAYEQYKGVTLAPLAQELENTQLGEEPVQPE